MLRQRRERRRLLLLGILLSRMLVRMVMVMPLKRKWNSWVHMVVRELVLHHGRPHGVVDQVMVMVLVMGPKRRERHWQEAWGWRHREHVRTRRHLPLPARRRPCRLSPALRILQLSKVLLQMSE